MESTTIHKLHTLSNKRESIKEVFARYNDSIRRCSKSYRLTFGDASITDFLLPDSKKDEFTAEMHNLFIKYIKYMEDYDVKLCNASLAIAKAVDSELKETDDKCTK